MLIWFRVGNYRSFKEEVALDMRALKRGAGEEKFEDNIAEVGGYRLLKSAAIYGANASGKSNLLKAIKFMLDFTAARKERMIQQNEITGDEEIPIEFFKLDVKTKNQPSLFEIALYLDGLAYVYGFEITKKSVKSEWLSLYDSPDAEERVVFNRTDQKVDFGSELSGKSGEVLKLFTEHELFKPNSLFIWVMVERNEKIASDFVEGFRKQVANISGIHDRRYEGYTARMFEDGELKDAVLELIVKRADFQVNDVHVDTQEVDRQEVVTLLKRLDEDAAKKFMEDSSESISRYEVRFGRKKYDSDEDVEVGTEWMDFDKEESDGTKKFFRLGGPMLHTLANGRTLTIDELDARLHPILSRELIRMFNSEENSSNAQLIFVSHDTNLLDTAKLRRDQIWYVAKNYYGASKLYSLADFVDADDDSIEEGYLRGHFGAIPHVEDFSDLVAKYRVSQKLNNSTNGE